MLGSGISTQWTNAGPSYEGGATSILITIVQRRKLRPKVKYEDAVELESTSRQAGSEPSVHGLVMVAEPGELLPSLGPERKLSKQLGDCRKVV